ncbi:P-type conjugative transfer ATPase TrbB [Henriciella mobilis]|jgi:P-type conjugative transfer ATPase TrbB|uniref:P-type conjugative transfer ATPase TrbB n=2 Tax=Hyphomonadaceae TaxID=69657 RepID=A0A399RHT5_9PROT|nr:P-type conjugative transfer ATPase TrbB [Henriciella mobilis]RIJ16275.1 P-type conjugative transfer ATPase TrbB [Henriciella mobilis]RIJ22643.1 P-type conjugative transfer ATPase TrbB [Henriciella mobilis]RIJ29299.1 P-type conjugative transfer ATPase TrbB [Henriciella mobilis]|tara:strand:+ start:8565 stop:9560 length:996 start_codon:yes stop_codon:yes gene_type:complete
MSLSAQQTQTETRRTAMLRTAFCPVVREALEAPDTIEVMANPDGSVWIEKAGIGVIISQHTLAPCDRERVIRLVASGVGEAAHAKSPIVSAELPGSGERFEGLLPPVSTAPCFSIRKPATTPFELGDYVTQGALAPALATALKDSIASHANILIAGGTSSGKTTFTNALLAEASLHDDRIVILEDTRELRCAAPNVVQLRTHRGSTSLQDLVRSTLRLRPDRIIVGEVRGAEALDLLKAWNTGHPGGITTLHANSAHGALARLEQLTLEATPRAPFDLIAEAIDVVVFMSRAGGQRRVEEALRVTGFDGEGYQTAPLVSRSLSLVQHGETQ